jgi:hypothetical protein
MKNFLELFLVMVAVSSPVLIIVFVRHYFRYRAHVAHRIGEAAREAAERDGEELRREVAILRRRVEVLEAIVTDKKYELSQRIANL